AATRRATTAPPTRPRRAAPRPRPPLPCAAPRPSRRAISTIPTETTRRARRAPSPPPRRRPRPRPRRPPPRTGSSAPRTDALMATALPLDRYAEIRAEMGSGRRHDEVLARAGLSADEWIAAQREWLARMGDDIGRGRFELTNRYSQAFLDRQRA